MQRITITILISFLIVIQFPTVLGAPDTPPALTWEILLEETPIVFGGASGTETNPCSLTIDEATQIRSVRVGDDGYIWTLEECRNANNNGFYVKRISPGGVIQCVKAVKQAEAATNDINHSPHSLAVDPEGRAWVWYDHAGHAPDPTLTLTIVDKNCTTDLDKSNNDFSSSSAIFWTTFNESAEQQFKAFGGGGLTRLGYNCTDLDTCTETFEINGDPGAGAVHYGGPYVPLLYGFDSNAGTFQTQIINQATGAILDSQAAPDTIEGLYRIWINGGNSSRLIVPYARLDGGFLEPRWFEQNSLTLSDIRQVVSPIEHTINTYDEMAASDALVDGDGNIYFCGSARTPGVKRDSALIKYNNTEFPGQRWNITYSKESGDANVDRAFTCDLSVDGSIYVGSISCANLDGSCRSYLRKYLGAAIGRTPQSTFDGFNATANVVAPGQIPDLGVAIKSFCQGLGIPDFICGLIILIFSTIAVMVFAMKFELPTFFLSGLTILGGIIALAYITLWPVWTAVVLGILAAAAITFTITRVSSGF